MARTKKKKKTEPSYLERRNGVFWVQIPVPPKAQALIGKKRLRRCLAVRDERLAKDEAGQWRTKFKRQIKAALAGIAPEKDSLEMRAMEWRKPDHQDKERRMVLHDIAESISIEDGMDQDDVWQGNVSARAATYLAIADGKATPLKLFLEEFITAYAKKGGGRAKRTVDGVRHSLNALIKWLGTEDIAATVEEVSRRVAMSYRKSLSDVLDRQTVNKRLGAMRG